MSAPVDAVIQALVPFAAAVLIVACCLLAVLIRRAWREVVRLARPSDEDSCGGRCRGHHVPRPRG